MNGNGAVAAMAKHSHMIRCCRFTPLSPLNHIGVRRLSSDRLKARRLKGAPLRLRFGPLSLCASPRDRPARTVSPDDPSSVRRLRSTWESSWKAVGQTSPIYNEGVACSTPTTALVFAVHVVPAHRADDARQGRDPCFYLDGKTRDRQTLVDAFQSPDGPPLFLISPKAGGLGLNLTNADYIFCSTHGETPPRRKRSTAPAASAAASPS